MTKGTEEASRQNHLFVVSKQVCSELGEEEGPDHNSSSLHSDADLTRAGRLWFDKSEQAANFPQRCKSKLVGRVAATGINGSLSASTLGALSLFDIYQQDPSAQGSLTRLWILVFFNYFIILSVDGTYNTCLVHMSGFLKKSIAPFEQGQEISDLFIKAISECQCKASHN